VQRNRRLLGRHERVPELHDALLDLTCTLIFWRFLNAMAYFRHPAV
jgi:hypothetical protein